MARRLTPGQIARKWQEKTSAATNDVKIGVMAVERSPTEAAAAKAEEWISGLNRAYREGIWQRALGRVTLQAWQQAMIEKGIPVIADRVRRATPKYQRFAEAWANYMQSVMAQLQQMPRGTLEQNLARSAFVIRQAAAARGRFRGGAIDQGG